jgi:hypothetical protein
VFFYRTTRRVWFCWNDALHGGSVIHLSILVQQATNTKKEFVEAND